MNSENIEKGSNVYDINGQNFDADLYLQKLLKECSLKQVMEHEAEIVKDTQNLHSDMQTLVYENYNKFISATDTVRKMKTDFKKMEDEMDLLASNMDSITAFSEQISSTLQDTRQKISKLSGIHSLLKRLQFLFKLPAKLKSLMNEKNYSEAIHDYMQAQRVLQQYGSMSSFQGIQEDCNVILVELKQKLRDQFKSNHATAKDLTESVDLLLQLGEPADKLCAEFLSCAEHRLGEQLVLLHDLSEQKDIIEFVDLGSSGFLSDLCLVVASYNDMFVKEGNIQQLHNETTASSQLNKFLNDNMKRYFQLVQNRIDLEHDVGDTGVLVRALDRFHRRLQAMNTLCQDVDLATSGTDIVLNAGRKQCRGHLQALKLHFADSLTKVRQALAAPREISQDGDSSNSNLSELLSSLVMANVEKIKGVLQDLMIFIQPDISFSMKVQFRDAYCVECVREGLVVQFIQHVVQVARTFCDGQKGSDPKCPLTLLLVLSKMCLEFQNTSVHCLLTQTDEWLEISTSSSKLTPENELQKMFQEAAQELLNYYVRMQGLNVSQMLRKSVETRDWLHTIEPRTVRAVMKRVVEDIAAVDVTVGVLFEEGARTEHSSDSSRKTHSFSVSRHQFRSNWSTYTPNHLESNIVTNLHKLFSERIEIFSSVEFSKNSILTGIIKISLKTFLECVRLKTFSKYGLQQIQVDTHYLQLYLWRFVADENLVHLLLDEILGSAVHRCLEPILMEPSVVEIICERS